MFAVGNFHHVGSADGTKTNDAVSVPVVVLKLGVAFGLFLVEKVIGRVLFFSKNVLA